MKELRKIMQININEIILIKALSDEHSEIIYANGKIEIIPYPSNELINKMCIVYGNSTLVGKKDGTKKKTLMGVKVPIEIVDNIITVPLGGVYQNTTWLFVPPLHIENERFNSVELFYPSFESPVLLSVSRRVLESAISRRSRFLEVNEQLTKFKSKK